MSRQPLFRPPETSRPSAEPCVRPLADLHETNEQYTAQHLTLPPHTSVALGGGSQLGGYVAAGEVDVFAADQGPVRLGTAGFFQVSHAASVEVSNATDAPATVITFVSPGTIDLPHKTQLRCVGPTQGDCIAAVGDLYRFLATAETSDGAFAIWEARVFPGGGPPPHVHTREEEGFFLLSGELQFTIDGQSTTAAAGSFANMPPGVEHAFYNSTDTVAMMLIAVAPGGMEQMFARTGVRLTSPDDRVLPPTPAEKQRLLQIAPEYGITIQPPSH